MLKKGDRCGERKKYTSNADFSKLFPDPMLNSEGKMSHYRHSHWHNIVRSLYYLLDQSLEVGQLKKYMVLDKAALCS